MKNNPTNLTDPTGHQAPGQLVGTGGDFMMPRMRAAGSVLGCVEDGSCESGEFSAVNNDSQTQLTVAQVIQIIQEAQNSSSDPVSTGMQIFNKLGNNVTVSGDVLREAVQQVGKQTGLKMEGVAADLIAHAKSVTKSGDQVTIANSSKFDVSQKGIGAHIDTKVSFKVGLENGLPSLTDVKGLKVTYGVPIVVTKMQVALKDGKHVLNVGGHIGFPPLPVWKKDIPIE